MIFTIAGYLVANLVVGILVITCIDKDYRIARWLDRAPRYWVSLIAVTLWPVVVWKWYTQKGK